MEKARLAQARCAPQWLLLHGFTGAPESWLGTVRQLKTPCELFVPALPGHRGSAFVGSASEALEAWSGNAEPHAAPAMHTAPGDFEQTLEALVQWARAAGFRRGKIAGYSLGGRLALALTLAHPDLFEESVLVSAHLGLRTPAERRARLAQDAAWIELLRTQPFDRFLERWNAQPLFESQHHLDRSALEGQDQIRRRQVPSQLADSLASAGLGLMPDLRERLQNHPHPIAALAGRQDTRFAELAAELVRLAPRGELHLVEGAHHNLLLESPGSVARVLERTAP